MIKPGIYKHFKGGYYKVLYTARHSEINEEVVVYQGLQGDCGIWVRPISMWNETVEHEGVIKKRFELFDVTSVDNLIDKVALIYIRNKKVLFTKSKGEELYFLPGGKREKGETDIQCLMREIKEELGVNLISESAKHYGTYFATTVGLNSNRLLNMTCYQATFKGEPKPCSEIEELVWLSYADRNTKNAPAGKTILDELYAKGLIE